MSLRRISRERVVTQKLRQARLATCLPCRRKPKNCKSPVTIARPVQICPARSTMKKSQSLPRSAFFIARLPVSPTIRTNGKNRRIFAMRCAPRIFRSDRFCRSIRSATSASRPRRNANPREYPSRFDKKFPRSVSCTSRKDTLFIISPSPSDASKNLHTSNSVSG